MEEVNGEIRRRCSCMKTGKMRNAIDESFREKSSFKIAFTSLAIIVALSLIDHSTGFEMSFSIFYLVPVAFAAWYGSRVVAGLVFVLSAAAWLIVDHTAGNSYSSPLYPYWNACVRLGFFIVISRLISTIKEKLELERKSARLDGLTGAMNARWFGEAAETVFQLAKRYERPTALGYIDIDNFKQVNDIFGHPAGDRVLATVASILMNSVRSSDIVGRLGGDEFAVLMPETTYSGAEKMFRDLHHKLLLETKEQGWPIGFSIGISFFKTAPESVNEAIRLADELMYQVKNQGKNAIALKESTGSITIENTQAY